MPGNLWGVSTQGGYAYSPLLSKELMKQAQPKLRFHQFCTLKEEWGKNAGETFKFDKYANISTQGGTLTETDTIPARSHRFYQGTATLREFGKLFAALIFIVKDCFRAEIRGFVVAVAA